MPPCVLTALTEYEAGTRDNGVLSMKAVTFDGTSVLVTDVDSADPRNGEVRVRVTAAGVCHSDLHVIRRVMGCTSSSRDGARGFRNCGRDRRGSNHSFRRRPRRPVLGPQLRNVPLLPSRPSSPVRNRGERRCPQWGSL